MSNKQNPLIGQIITAIHVASDKRAMRFDLGSGESVVVKADGDCCSNTWIESLDTPALLIGGTVTSVEDIPMPDDGAARDEDDVVAFYGCKISSTKGACVIDYRNSSNGYYGGNLSWPNDDDFYGGVHGQNVSTEQWQQVAP